MKTEVSNPRSNARRYQHSIKGLTPANHHCALPSRAGFICIAPPKIPPLADFEAWLAALPVAMNHKRSVDARQLRRIVTMRANGCGDKEIDNSLGMKHGFSNRWRHLLPKELGGDAHAPLPLGKCNVSGSGL